MLKSELIQRMIALNPDLSETVCRTMVEAFFSSLTNQLVDGGAIELRGFGRLFLTQHAERTVRDPRTGKVILKNEFIAIRFRASKVLCARLNR
ncbi:MAG TPA: HU family DNA-binding protein [Sphingomonas sp.]|nr:HU family DNA-binding protein [Sphingomonas sp.]